MQLKSPGKGGISCSLCLVGNSMFCKERNDVETGELSKSITGFVFNGCGVKHEITDNNLL